MIEYIIKSSFCLIVLYGSYYFSSGKSTNHNFKRVYLLIALIFSLSVPFFEITISNKQNNIITESAVGLQKFALIVKSQDSLTGNGDKINDNLNTISIIELIGLFYIVISTLLFVKFLFNVIKLNHQARKNEKVIFHNQKIILLDKNTIPHSFFNHIFVSRDDYHNRIIDKDLLHHELAHVRQCHSLDIILIEIIFIFYWFNPIIYLYKNSIKLNHEFLADQYVLETGANHTDYSYRLINFTSKEHHHFLTSGFYFSQLQKRLIMLSKGQKKRHFNYKLMSILPVFSVLFAVTAFSVSQDAPKRKPDRLHYFSGTGGGYRINDSTLYYYGGFSYISASKKSKVTAERLKVSNQLCNECNHFENDFLSGKVYMDIVDVYTNELIFRNIMTISADKILYSKDSLLVELRGNAKVSGADVLVESENINLNLNVWGEKTQHKRFMELHRKIQEAKDRINQ